MGLPYKLHSKNKQKIHEAFRNLESESIYTRFFLLKKDLTDKELQAATEGRLASCAVAVAFAHRLMEKPL